MGSLEGANRLCLDVLLHPWLQRTFLDKFDCAARHPRDPLLHLHNVQQLDAAGIVERSQQGNIGIETVVSACRRTEQRKANHACGP